MHKLIPAAMAPSLAADASKRKLADFMIFFAPPRSFSRFNPRLTRRWIKTGAPVQKSWVD